MVGRGERGTSEVFVSRNVRNLSHNRKVVLKLDAPLYRVLERPDLVYLNFMDPPKSLFAPVLGCPLTSEASRSFKSDDYPIRGPSGARGVT